MQNAFLSACVQRASTISGNYLAPESSGGVDEWAAIFSAGSDSP
ncbi:MAG: hypothetical protein JWL79_3537 [Frankiales bacterium]|nr:hypothetical protein [Frankiales bacterium]